MPALAQIPPSPLPPVAKPGATVPRTADARVPAMAKEFEATFLSLLLKEMRQTLEPDGLFAGDSGDVQGGLFDLYLGQHLAAAGGVGLADALVRQLRSSAYAPPSPNRPAAVSAAG